MFILSQDIFNILRLCFKYANFYGTVPYEFDEKAQNLRYSTSSTTKTKLKIGFRAWAYMRYIVLLHQVFLTARIIESTVGSVEQSLILRIVEIIQYVSTLIVSVTQILFMQKERQLLVFTNRWIHLFKVIQGESSFSFSRSSLYVLSLLMCTTYLYNIVLNLTDAKSKIFIHIFILLRHFRISPQILTPCRPALEPCLHGTKNLNSFCSSSLFLQHPFYLCLQYSF